MQRGLHLAAVPKNQPRGPPTKAAARAPLCSAVLVVGSFAGARRLLYRRAPLRNRQPVPPAPPRPAAPVGGSGERKADLGVRCVIAVVRKVGVSLARGAKLIKGKGHAKLGLDSTTTTWYYDGARLVSALRGPAFWQSVTLGEEVIRKDGFFFWALGRASAPAFSRVTFCPPEPESQPAPPPLAPD